MFHTGKDEGEESLFLQPGCNVVKPLLSYLML